MRYFSLDEFKCKCCGELPEQGMSSVLLEKLDTLRGMIGKPIIVTSGYRCPIHNRNVGGVKSSTHVKGNGVDIVCDVPYSYLVAMVERVGFDGVGLYPEQGFIHIDCRDEGNSPNTYRW